MNDTKLSVWGVRGWDTKQQRYDILSYVTETKSEAYAKCVAIHPTFDVEDVYFIADY
jgi:hypothetical protein